MNQKYEKYLPIGSVVLLNEGTKRLMITGFCVVPNDDKTKVYDYSGCLYPEGVISSDQIALFNHDQIKSIYAIGYSDDEEKKFKDNLKSVLSGNNNE